MSRQTCQLLKQSDAAVGPVWRYAILYWHSTQGGGRAGRQEAAPTASWYCSVLKGGQGRATRLITQGNDNKWMLKTGVNFGTNVTNRLSSFNCVNNRGGLTVRWRTGWGSEAIHRYRRTVWKGMAKRLVVAIKGVGLGANVNLMAPELGV
jgi:hypothetical protein